MKKQKQATVFIEMFWGNQRKSQGSGWKGNEKKEFKALGTNQCACCKEEGHWKRECPKNNDKNTP